MCVGGRGGAKRGCAMNRRGMTLVEVLAALGLSAVLLVSALGAISAIARSNRVSITQGNSAGATDHTIDTITQVVWQDLENARACKRNGETIEITGACGISPNTLELTHHEVIVRYAVKPYGKLSVLEREQLDADDTNGRWTAILSTCVSSISLRPVATGTGPAHASSGDALPAQICLIINTSGGHAAFEKTLTLR